VEVKIFTIAFRRVSDKTFVLPAGTQNIPIELKGRTGAPLANGLYYIVVQTNKSRFIEKLIISR
jgi:hypothetical protein